MEFLMKDLYSFHKDEKDFSRYYELSKKVYQKIFMRCGLEAIITEASGAGFTKELTHEFQVITEAGEDTIIYCDKKHFSQNKEMASFEKGDKCPRCANALKSARAVEVGNIFPLGEKYSKDMGAFFVDKNGKKKPVVMGCYGIGIDRVIATIVEMHHDENGIIWPKELAPFNVHLLPLFSPTTSYLVDGKIKKMTEKLYQDLQKAGIEVLYDDRKEKSVGEKFADADLIGIPWRIVLSERTLKRDSVEVKERRKKEAKLVKITRLPQFLRKYRI
jgi:prolyl-tRNA synthetase